MQKRRLGNSTFDFTVIGFGAWAIGGPWEYGWGETDDNQAVAAIHHAIELGINWIDTAHVYGFGHSEEVVAKALKGRRDGVIVATKCGLLADGKGGAFGSLKAESVRKELEGSLKRLNVDVIDLYQIHWPNPDAEIEFAWEEIARAVDQGLVRYAAVSNFNVSQMQRCQRIHPITSLQPPYSMIRRGIEDEILPFCREQNIGVVAYSPMASGLLTGKVTTDWVNGLAADDWRKKHSPEYREPRLSVNIEFVNNVLVPIANKHRVSPGQVAVAWALRDTVVTSAIVGARTPAQIEDTVRAASIALNAEDLHRIEDGLKNRDLMIKETEATL